MLTGRVNSLPGHIQAVYVHNILKVFSVILVDADAEKAAKVRLCPPFTYTFINLKKEYKR